MNSYSRETIDTLDKEYYRVKQILAIANSFLNKIGFDKESYVITGSTALIAQGVPLQRRVEDIDIILFLDMTDKILKEKTIAILKALQSATAAEYDTDYLDNSEETFMCKLSDSVKVNFFLVDKERKTEIPTVQRGSNSFSTVYYTLVQKLALNRQKDLKDLMNIINEFTSVSQIN